MDFWSSVKVSVAWQSMEGQKALRFHEKKVFIFVPKMNGLMVLKQHEGE